MMLPTQRAGVTSHRDEVFDSNPFVGSSAITLLSNIDMLPRIDVVLLKIVSLTLIEQE